MKLYLPIFKVGFSNDKLQLRMVLDSLPIHCQGQWERHVDWVNHENAIVYG